MRWQTAPQSQDKEKGQNLVELALLMPVMILLLALLLDVGRAFNAYMVITNAAREGARYGSQSPDHPSGIVQTARAEAARGGLVGADLAVAVTGSVRGQTMTVTASYQFPTILGDIVGLPTIPLQSRCEMLIYGP